MEKLILCFLMGLFLLLSGLESRLESGDTLSQLLQKLEKIQEIKDVPIYTPPWNWAKKKGSYRSDGRINFIGNPTQTLLRNVLRCYDNNNFVTSWVTTSLLEAFAYGKAPQPTENQILLGITAINEYQNKNFPTGSGIVSFWPQAFNATSGLWSSTPENFLGFISFVNNSLPWRFIVKVLDLLELKDLADELENVRQVLAEASTAVHIPGDFDSSSLNLGIGGLLSEQKLHYPLAYKSWMENNTHIELMIKALKKYAYRPFSEDLNSNLIDPRSYFSFHGFLEDAKSANQNLAIITTWVQNLDEIKNQTPSVVIPFNINIIDINVVSNAVFGITKAVLENIGNISTWFDEDIQMIYMNSTSLIVWCIETDIIEARLDIVLPYYPSIYSFYWFLSRSVFQMETQLANAGSLPHSSLVFTYRKLSNILRTKGTKFLLSRAKSDSLQKVYFEDFLGNSDRTIFNKSKLYGEDRLFSTSVVINCLLSTWTYFNKTSNNLNWIKGTPQNVSDTVKYAAHWLDEDILGSTYRPLNVFFSGSIKTFNQLPFWYPANYLKYLNGSTISPSANVSLRMVVGMTGVVSPVKFEEMVNQTHFGVPTPLYFQGYNVTSNFPFWSSEAFTYATSLQALSWFKNIL